MSKDYIVNLVPGLAEYKNIKTPGWKGHAVKIGCTALRIAGIVAPLVTGNPETASFYIGPTAGLELGTFHENNKPKASVEEKVGNYVIDNSTNNIAKLFEEKGAKITPKSKKWIKKNVKNIYSRSLEENKL